MSERADLNECYNQKQHLKPHLSKMTQDYGGDGLDECSQIRFMNQFSPRLSILYKNPEIVR